ncbi:MAG: 3-hydroxyacyl-ACP dehydratase FabZ [Candidatus Melainabacteria bacterium]|jgi:3-hydroxyacyl-[acyl-carrier-protein] dehydratase
MFDFSTLKLPFNVEQIQKIIPHRYPFLLVDKITDLDGNYAKGYKNISISDPVFQGHFPEKAIFPGVLIIEALAQLSCVSEILKEGNNGCNKIGLFAGIDSARFKKPVFPGDRLDLEIWMLWSRRGVGKCKAQASVDGEIAFIGELAFALVDKETIL